jgi:beta-hydroxylase
MSPFIDQLRKKKRKFVKDLGGNVLWKLERFMAKHSKVSNAPFLDPYQFEWANFLEQNWRIIRDELDQILQFKESIPRFQDISEDQKSISKDDDWRTFFLYGFGYKAEINCSRCPETTRLIESIPGMTTAFFSILNPGKHIPEHRGVFKGFLRYHLGLKVPQQAENCRIRVDGVTAHWQEGKGMLFDDTYLHEVWNDTGETRVVLLLDVIRPLRFPANALNSMLINMIKHTGYVQDAKKNQEAWEQKFEISDRRMAAISESQSEFSS